MSTENNQENQQQDNQKEAKKFDANLRKLVALMGGTQTFKKEKVGKDDLSTLIVELTKEKKEGLFKEFKEKANNLVEKKRAFDKMVVEEEKKFQKIILDKKKEFNKEMEGIFGIVDRIDLIEKEYYDTLTSTAIPIATPKEEEKEE
jgi:hypothetical protein